MPHKGRSISMFPIGLLQKNYRKQLFATTETIENVIDNPGSATY